MNDYFRFKKFIINQGQTAMKVGTDGVLLGAWADLTSTTSLLDIGTGTGLLALMAAQRNPTLRIDAVEIDPPAYEQAIENIKQSPWSKRIQVFQLSIFDFHPTQQYGHILCNPPFFIDSTPAPNQSRTLARHCNTFSHVQLLETVNQLLMPSGKFSVILPVPEAEKLLCQAGQYHLYPSKITKVIPTPTKSPKRYLLEFTCTRNLITENELVVELSRHEYSQDYISLTRDFYLNM